ncbi:MAG TPA: ketosteroid isomerase [Planctomycetaceae bacterium]|nr:ketosteroid isomerase [Planctomycetaceae bacterium]
MENTVNNSANVRVVKGFLDAQYAGDFDTAFGSFAQPDFSWIVGSADNETLRDAIPWAGHTHLGKEGYVQLVTELFSEFEALEFNPARFTDAGECVFVEGNFVFRHKETGKTVNSDFLSRFDMKDGKIIGGQFYENTQGVAEARRKD